MQPVIDKDTLRELRRRLHKIYLDHDIPGFRAFLVDRSITHPEVVPFIDENDRVLSDLMHTMKSQLLYFGEDCQESRNMLRYQQFWEESNKAMEDIPLCAGCKYLRKGPKPDEKPCIQLGSTPMDIACRAFQKA